MWIWTFVFGENFRFASSLSTRRAHGLFDRGGRDAIPRKALDPVVQPVMSACPGPLIPPGPSAPPPAAAADAPHPKVVLNKLSRLSWSNDRAARLSQAMRPPKPKQLGSEICHRLIYGRSRSGMRA